MKLCVPDSINRRLADLIVPITFAASVTLIHGAIISSLPVRAENADSSPAVSDFLSPIY